MQKLFDDTRLMDKACREKYGLSEDIMMENAASALESAVRAHVFNPSGYYLNRPAVLILCGSGNNGADGYALARRLSSHGIAVTVCKTDEPKTEIAKVQMERASKLGVTFISLYDVDDYIAEKSFDLRVIVDCIFGSGFHGELPEEAKAVIASVNDVDDVYRIACDIPSGMAFNADETVTMGALKFCLYADSAKDFTGKITLSDLGVDRSVFEAEGRNCAWLLESSDLQLPYRKKQNVNKGTFGHVAVASGEKCGAAVIAASAALKFGAGLATVVDENESLRNPYYLMSSSEYPENTSAVAFGMGIGRNNTKAFEKLVSFTGDKDTCVVFDADAFYMNGIKDVLKQRSAAGLETVVTPHPKEFASLLELCGLGSYSVKEILADKAEFSRKFAETFPGVVLLLKGSSVFISVKDREGFHLYVNALGTNALAKAGSGDVLAGLIASLMAQGRTALDAAANASLAHALASEKVKNSFSLEPFQLIDMIAEL